MAVAKRQQDKMDATKGYPDQSVNKSSAGIIQFPTLLGAGEDKPSRFKKLLAVFGIISMAGSQPKGDQINYATILLLLAVIGAIGGLYTWTAKVNYEYGYEKGKAETETQQLKREIEDAKAKAERAERLSIASGSDSDGHKDTKEKKK